jgi:hypothetical protein
VESTTVESIFSDVIICGNVNCVYSFHSFLASCPSRLISNWKNYLQNRFGQRIHRGTILWNLRKCNLWSLWGSKRLPICTFSYWKRFEEKENLHPDKVKDLLVVLHSAILEVVDLLVKECVKPEKEQIHNMSRSHNIFIHGVKYKTTNYIKCLSAWMPFLGVSLGQVGVIYMLLKATQAVSWISLEYKSLKQAIKNSLLRLLDTLEQHGKLPSIRGKDYFHCHFCNGAPGAIPLISLAMRIYPEL